MLDFLKLTSPVTEETKGVIDFCENNAELQTSSNSILTYLVGDKTKITVRHTAKGTPHLITLELYPHYHANNYHHNGDDLTPKRCIASLSDMLSVIGVYPSFYDVFKVQNIEFGLNLIKNDVGDIIEGITYSKKTPFVRSLRQSDTCSFKISNATKYKQIKAYAKGLQFSARPEYGIDPNTFRFEVKSKQAKYIKKLNVNSLQDLFKTAVYNRMGCELLKEWENVLLIQSVPKTYPKNLIATQRQRIRKGSKECHWRNLISKDKRNSVLQRERNLYYSNLGGACIHTAVKNSIKNKVKIFMENDKEKGKTCRLFHGLKWAKKVDFSTGENDLKNNKKKGGFYTKKHVDFSTGSEPINRGKTPFIDTLENTIRLEKSTRFEKKPHQLSVKNDKENDLYSRGKNPT